MSHQEQPSTLHGEGDSLESIHDPEKSSTQETGNNVARTDTDDDVVTFKTWIVVWVSACTILSSGYRGEGLDLYAHMMALTQVTRFTTLSRLPLCLLSNPLGRLIYLLTTPEALRSKANQIVIH